MRTHLAAASLESGGREGIILQVGKTAGIFPGSYLSICTDHPSEKMY